jgi:hypothetical protein
MPATTPANETYVVEDDTTLTVQRERRGAPDQVRGNSEIALRSISTLTKTFNFASQQVTTTTREYLYLMPTYTGNSTYSSGSASVALASHTQNFADVQSPDEILRMHAKLLELGGHPPAAEELRLSNTQTVIKGAAAPKMLGGQ